MKYTTHEPLNIEMIYVLSIKPITGGGAGVLRPFSTIKAIQGIIFTHLACIEERNERQKSDTVRHGIPPQPPLFLYVPGVQLRYTVSLHGYVTIRQTMMNTMDIYNEMMSDMWEPAPGIEPGSSA